MTGDCVYVSGLVVFVHSGRFFKQLLNCPTVFPRIIAARRLFQIRTAAALISNNSRAATIRIFGKNFDPFQIIPIEI
jgi:hypothetical protein